MKKTISFALLALSVVGANGQTPTAADYEGLSGTKTMVVTDENMFSDYNMSVKDNIPKDWKLTQTEYISRKKFEQKRTDHAFSFLVTTTGYYKGDDSREKYTYMSLLMGKKGSQLTTMPDLISVPLCYASVSDQNYVYKLPAIIRFMQKHVEKMKAEPKLISDSPLLVYRKDKKSLSGKTLYLLKSELEKSIQSESALKKVYPYAVKIVSEDDIRKAIEEKDDNVVFLHKVGPEKSKNKALCFKILMGAADSEIYFFDYHKIDRKNGDYLRAKDLEKAAKN